MHHNEKIKDLLRSHVDIQENTPSTDITTIYEAFYSLQRVNPTYRNYAIKKTVIDENAGTNISIGWATGTDRDIDDSNIATVWGNRANLRYELLKHL